MFCMPVCLFLQVYMALASMRKLSVCLRFFIVINFMKEYAWIELFFVRFLFPIIFVPSFAFIYVPFSLFLFQQTH